jgi:hypothetical protein
VPQHLLVEFAFEEATEATEKVKQAFAICSPWEQEDPAVTSELVGVERNHYLGLRKVLLHRFQQLFSRTCGSRKDMKSRRSTIFDPGCSGPGHHTRSILR